MNKTAETELSKVSRDKIKSYTDQIEKTWHKALESIFAIGDLLLQARKDFKQDPDAYQVLINQLSFGPRVAERLAAIADTPFLRKPSVQKSLPPCWTTLNELRQLSETKFNRAIKNKSIKAEMTRSDAIALANPSSKRTAPKSDDKISSKGSSESVYANITFSSELVLDYSDRKTLMDIQFVCNLICDLFENGTQKSTVKVNSTAAKPSKKLQSSEKVFLDLIAQARKVENHSRKKRGKAPLSKLQEILSLLGIDPDNLINNEFSVLERLAVSYAKRNGITCIHDEQLKWSAAKSNVEPELLGSFLNDVEKQVSRILSGKEPSRGLTNIYEMDSEEDMRTKSQEVITSNRSA